MAAPISNNSIPLYRDANQSIVKFLGWKDSLTLFARLSRIHRDDVYNGGLNEVKSLTIPAHLLRQLFENIGKFNNLHSLDVVESQFSFQTLGLPPIKSKIDSLNFRFNSPNFGLKLPTSHVLMLLEAIPELKKLTLTAMAELGQNPSQFQPVDGKRLSKAVVQNLKLLTELDLSWAEIKPHEVLEILECSSNFTSIKLRSCQCTNAVFRELVFSAKLTHLDISEVGFGDPDLDYGILAECHSLESFRHCRRMTEDALILIIEANLSLKKLDLCNTERRVVTDRVLEVVGRKLSGLLELGINCEYVSDVGICSVIKGCPHLIDLHLLFGIHITVDALRELRNLTDLKKMRIYKAALNDDKFFAGLATLRKLTYLELNSCTGVTEERLQKIHTLVNLDGISKRCSSSKKLQD